MHIIHQIIAVFAKSSVSVGNEDGDILDNIYDDVHLWI
jgi:hypothetical protein